MNPGPPPLSRSAGRVRLPVDSRRLAWAVRVPVTGPRVPAGPAAGRRPPVASARRDATGTPRHGSAGPTHHGPARSAPGRPETAMPTLVRCAPVGHPVPDTRHRPAPPSQDVASMCQQIMQALGRVTATNEALASRVANLEHRDNESIPPSSPLLSPNQMMIGRMRLASI